MNAREQFLQRQNQRLQQQVHFLLDVVDRMAADHEFLGSVACGFAWDMQNAYGDYTTAPLNYWSHGQAMAGEVP